MKINVYLKKQGQIICYGELGSMIRSKDRRHLTLKEKTKIIVKELNELLPTTCLKQKTMYYFAKEEK